MSLNAPPHCSKLLINLNYKHSCASIKITSHIHDVLLLTLQQYSWGNIVQQLLKEKKGFKFTVIKINLCESFLILPLLHK